MSKGISRRFNGRYDHKLDPKNRVSIPLEWRPSEGDALYLILSERNGFTGIKALTETRLDEIEEGVRNEEGLTTKQKNEYMEWLYAACVKTTVNNQGKLLIPKKMCEQAQLADKVVLIGGGNAFDLWKPSTYEKMDTARKANITNINDSYGYV